MARGSDEDTAAVRLAEVAHCSTSCRASCKGKPAVRARGGLRATRPLTPEGAELPRGAAAPGSDIARYSR
jgi:hypothetical protein